MRSKRGGSHTVTNFTLKMMDCSEKENCCDSRSRSQSQSRTISQLGKDRVPWSKTQDLAWNVSPDQVSSVCSGLFWKSGHFWDSCVPGPHSVTGRSWARASQNLLSLTAGWLLRVLFTVTVTVPVLWYSYSRHYGVPITGLLLAVCDVFRVYLTFMENLEESLN